MEFRLKETISRCGKK